MIQSASILPSLPMLDAGVSIATDGWDFAPVATFIAIILIIGFAVVAAGWAIKRDI